MTGVLTKGGLAALLMGANTLFAQCPMCKRPLTHSVEGARLARGFNNGILLLLIVPFLLFGAISFLVYEARRRQTWRSVAGGGVGPGPPPGSGALRELG